MSRAPLHALIWSEEQCIYELYTRGQLKLRFRPVEEAAWLVWLGSVSSFAFHGKGGSLNIYQEKRPRGGAYWYAYHTKEGRTRKRYLGQTESLRFSRLEETARSLLHVPQPATTTEQGMMLHSSRLTPPRLPNALVERERLLIALDEALSTPLTLLSASAGWGKTTLLSAWAHRHQEQVAWLSLDELNNSPTRFWGALIAALRRCPSLAVNFGADVVAQLQSPQPPPLFSCLSVLLHELENCMPRPAPVVLIVDDYQMIEDPAIHEGMSLFLEHLTAHLHVVLSSRVDPDLPIARWRAHGQLTEIRTDDLRFNLEEASYYLGHLLSPILSEEEVRKLVSRTEGWIAGLHLAALSLQKREDRAIYLEALTGSQRYLLDYVQQDILAALPESIRDFLLHSAIISRLDASVCQAVTASPTQTASQYMLVFLERANLFLVPLDEERHTYRLHDLFREALLATLRTIQPEMEPVLHRRAARFYEAEGQWHEAIAHALVAADYPVAVRLMEQTVEQFWVRGEAETMVRWVLALPEYSVREYARLALTAALYLLATGANTAGAQSERYHQQVRQLMARVEKALWRERDAKISITHTETDAVSPTGDREVGAIEDALLHRRLHLLHLYLVLSEVAASGDYERLSRRQQEIEEELGHDEEVVWQMVPLACTFALHYSIRQEGARLLPQLLTAKEKVRWEVPSPATYKVRQWVALSAVEAGRLHFVYEESRQALDLLKRLAGYALLNGYFELALVQVLYQWNRLVEARDLLHTVVQVAEAWHQLDLLTWGYVWLVKVALATRDHLLAERSLHELEHLMRRNPYADYPDWLPTLRADLWLAQGQLEAATDWAEGVVFPQGAWEGSWSYEAFLVVMRVYFAQQRWMEALELLERWSEHLDRPANIRITITYLTQYMVALYHAGRNEQAHEIAARLFALTEPEGYLRVYLDEGEPMRQALEALLTPHSQRQELAPSTSAYISKLLAVFEQERQGAGTSLASPTSTPALSSAQQASAVFSASSASLTRREQEVLRLLATGASNQEIAQTLVIELPTVKKHVSNLLGKLRASSRTQAISRARALSLL